ncbi:ERB1 protein, partial [Oreotrochilus melanogaster]|nr:ERB1 protein [Oreotrochilus melanogaster]
IWVNDTAKALPSGVFLICGDRAWQGIPRNAVGGPCYLGSLTLFAPRYADLRKLRKPKDGVRGKRSIGLTPQCNDNVELLSDAARTALAIFIPGAAAGNTLRELAKLACWTEKQANITTQILNDLLMDQNNLRHALLQNRAAVDFLLLAHGRGCEDFDGMCCMNLKDHSQSIHLKIQQLVDHTKKIKQDVGFFGLDGLSDWFGVTGWVKSLLKSWFLLLLLLLLVIMIV